MGDYFWRPISVDCLDPETFPDVALYFKTGGRYILYKNADCQLTEADQQRMENSRIEFVYVRLGDLHKVNNYLSKTFAIYLPEMILMMQKEVCSCIRHQLTMLLIYSKTLKHLPVLTVAVH